MVDKQKKIKNNDPKTIENQNKCIEQKKKKKR